MPYRSGELNAKQRELVELQALAQRRLKGTRANIADGIKAAKEVKRDLSWTQKRVKYVLLRNHIGFQGTPFHKKT